MNRHRGNAIPAAHAPWVAMAVALSAMLAGAAWAQETPVTLRGRLVLQGEDQPSRWRILAGPRLMAELPRDPDGKPLGTAPGEDGAFTVECAGPGFVLVCPYVGGRLATDGIVPVRLGGERPVPEEIALKPSPPREGVDFALQRADGTALARRIRVHVYNDYGEVDGSAGGVWTDEAGVVRLEELPCGQYDLWLEPPPEGAEPLAAACAGDLAVTPGEGPQVIAVPIPSPATVTGRLVLPDGNMPAAGYVLATQSGTIPDEETPRERWAAAYARGAQGCYAETVVAPDGTFTLQGLTPGALALDIRKPGEREAWCTVFGVPAKAGEVTNLDTVQVARNGWQSMFDRRTLAGWAESDFYGRSDVRPENDRVVLQTGSDMTGIMWTGDLPRVDYEVSLEAMRVSGGDFFCGLTFPVKENPCTLVIGGWGGTVVGLSSLDGYDASENETSRWMRFDNQRWYRVRLRVTPGKIEAWLDGKQVVDVNTAGRKISIRWECEPCVPFGLATWRTAGAVRDLRLRKLD